MKYLTISLGIFLCLSITRFLPHPPNFTSLQALSFYVPVFFGIRYIPAVILSFVVTDIFIEIHYLTFFTWGSVLVIGLISKFFSKKILSRICGSLLGACIFFLITNFGVWITGSYGYTLDGLIKCYFLAIPFFNNALLSTLIFAVMIETIYILRLLKLKLKH